MSAGASLDRPLFVKGTASHYFSADELAKQAGVPWPSFAAMALKELVDNSADACERAGIAPQMALTIEAAGDELILSVQDNGPGIPIAAVTKIADYTVVASTNIGHRAPTRGQQGNALPVVLALPRALGSDKPVIIEALGVHHEVRASVDVGGNARVAHTMTERPTRPGTLVTLTIPAHGQDLDALAWARNYALVNPHLRLAVKIRGFGAGDDESTWHAKRAPSPLSESHDFYERLVDWPGQWQKWLPSYPTSPLWYRPEHLHELLCRQIATSPERTLQDFLQDFKGLTGRAKLQAICTAVPTIRRLGDLLEQPGFLDDPSSVAPLLRAMQAEATVCVKPEALGVIGAELIRQRWEAWYGITANRFWYRKKALGVDGIPVMIEVAVAQTSVPGDVSFGLNFAVPFRDPFGNILLQAGPIRTYGVRPFLQEAHVPLGGGSAQEGEWAWEPTEAAALVHLTSPALGSWFLSRGKAEMRPPRVVAAAVAAAVWSACQELYKEGEAREKAAAQQAKRERKAREEAEKAATRAERATRGSVKDACFTVMAEAFAHAGGAASLRVSRRTLFYALGNAIDQRDVDAGQLTWDNFNTILDRYLDEFGKEALPGLYAEPRGVLHEPHTGASIPLGTIEVEGYTIPSYVYTRILFVEKQGLWPVIADSKLAERYDLAIIAGQGFATEAARLLLQRAKKDHDYQIFVIHDADAS